MKTLFVVAVIVVTLNACGPRGYWTRSGFDQGQWQKDQYECSYNAETACHYWDPKVSVVSGAICFQNHYSRCLTSRGYFWVSTR